MAEAKFLRAYAYFNLVRLYGKVPLITSVLDPTDSESPFKRTEVAEVYKQIVMDLQEGVSNLDDTYKIEGLSGCSTQGLLAKVYLTQPSPNYGDAEKIV